MSLANKKVLFIDSVHPILQEILENHGYYCLDITKESIQEINKQLIDSHGVVIRSRFKFTRELMDLAPSLKFIARAGSGLENIDISYAQKRNILCFNSPEGNKDALGEHCIAMLLNMFNKINKAHKEVSAGVWLREENRGVELKGKTVGIIGYGVMGESFAKKLSGFEASVLAYDVNKNDYSSEFVKEASLQTLHERCDILSVHVNYRPENHHFINDAYINAFKKNIYLINTARGMCLNTIDLIKNLTSGKVLGACLDVLEIEQTNFQLGSKSQALLEQLASFNQVLLTPHVGGWTKESYLKLSAVLGDKIIAAKKRNAI